MKIAVTGCTGLLGSALLDEDQDGEIINICESSRGQKIDLTLSMSVNEILAKCSNFDILIHTAAKVGGVKANAAANSDFFEKNMKMNLNIFDLIKIVKPKKTILILSSCIYPNEPPEYPLKEWMLHVGYPHHTNYGYSFAKRMMAIQAQAIREQYGINISCIIPNNLYGKNDNFNIENGHVIPSIIHKIKLAKETKQKKLTLFGTGREIREFTFVNDLAKKILVIAKTDISDGEMNIGNVSESICISDLAHKIAAKMNYKGTIEFSDDFGPGGQLSKPISNSKFGFLYPEICYSDWTCLNDGLDITIRNFINDYNNLRK